MIAIILLVHWIADFVLQKREWANNKSKSIIALSKHCAVYSLCLIPFIFQFGVMYWVINSVGHFLIDFCTSKVTSKLYLKGDYHNFFVVIGFDQFLHYILLFYPFLTIVN